MPIRLPTGPEAGFKIVEKHISAEDAGPPDFNAFRPDFKDGQLVSVEPMEAARLVNAVRGDVIPISVTLQSTEPYPIYTLSREALPKKVSLRSAKLTAWHYILVKDDRSVHSLVELAVLGPAGQALSYTALRPREYAERMVEAIDHASKLPEAGQQEYELRVLRAPSLSFLGVWLHTEQWIHDWFIAIGDGEPDYAEKQVMNESKLAEVLAEIAERRAREIDREVTQISLPEGSPYPPDSED
jgi:hypothetical protein